MAIDKQARKRRVLRKKQRDAAAEKAAEAAPEKKAEEAAPEKKAEEAAPEKAALPPPKKGDRTRRKKAAAAALEKGAASSSVKPKLRPSTAKQLKDAKDAIRVIKRGAGVIRFIKKYEALERKESAYAMKLLTNRIKKAKGEMKTPKITVKRMRRGYHTQLTPRSAVSKEVHPEFSHKLGAKRLKKNFVPGKICIILKGRYQGRRVIFVKQLKGSGLCLVTGPHGVNGVPLRRISQKFLVATSVLINMKGIDIPKSLNDTYFKKAKVSKKKKTKKSSDADEIFKTKKKVKSGIDDLRKKTQKSLDTALCKSIKKMDNHKMIIRYLKCKFAVMGNRYPHDIKF